MANLKTLKNHEAELVTDIETAKKQIRQLLVSLTEEQLDELRSLEWLIETRELELELIQEEIKYEIEWKRCEKF